MGSMLTAVHPSFDLKAAERVEIHFEEMSIPISINELDNWSKRDGEGNTELATWLSLLGFENRTALLKFLKEPHLKDEEIILQFLRSWFGRELFNELGKIIQLDNEKSEKKIFQTIENILITKDDASLISILQSMPGEVININLDRLVKIIGKWRTELKKQQKLLSDLNLSSLSIDKSNIEITSTSKNNALKESFYEIVPLNVKHRNESLNIEIWKPSSSNNTRSDLIIFMPGIGGDRDHFRWLARSLSHHGWPVILLQHPGSDSKYLKALFSGEVSAPGIEIVPDRIKDIYSVIEAKSNNLISVPGENIVLIGHSLGSLTAFLAAGAPPGDSLKQSCSYALEDFSLTNLSVLLQCQFVDYSPIAIKEIHTLKAIIGINSFGSLIWPEVLDIDNQIPFFFAGGTFDLVTPAIYEQLGLFMATKPHPHSRVLIIEGASHFSPIRVGGQLDNKTNNDVFNLTKDFVGLHPLSVQSLLSNQIINFLDNLNTEKGLRVNLNLEKDNIKYHLIDRSKIEELLNN